jgi:hypothetical protein
MRSKRRAVAIISHVYMREGAVRLYPSACRAMRDVLPSKTRLRKMASKTRTSPHFEVAYQCGTYHDHRHGPVPGMVWRGTD